MLALMIIDDEPFIRDGLSSIPWAQHGIDLISVASDSDQALHELRERRPDIVLSDIRMPGMDGISLSRIIRDENPCTRIILLTGYKEFGYAQSAVKLGVSDFILKPSAPDEIVDAVCRARNEILRERRTRRVLQRARFALIEQSLADALECAEGPGAAWLNAAVGVRRYVVLALQFASVRHPLSALRASVHRSVRSLGQASVIAKEGNGALVFVDLSGSDAAGTDEVLTAARLLKGRLEHDTSTVFVGISAISSHASEIRKVADSARCALDAACLLTGSEVESADALDSIFRGWGPPMDTVVDSLSAGIASADLSMVHVRCQELAAALHEDGTLFVARLLLGLLRRKNMHLSAELGAECATILRDLRERRASCAESLERISRLLISTGLSGLEGGHALHHSVARALEHIRLNFATITGLAEVARVSCLHPVYLSRLIKRETGKTFNQILTETRLEHACRLLKGTDARVYEVAEEVGFSDHRYFTQLFKHRLRLTPVEYRQRNGKPGCAG
jgi:two-component system response regulator YesN